MYKGCMQYGNSGKTTWPALRGLASMHGERFQANSVKATMKHQSMSGSSRRVRKQVTRFDTSEGHAEVQIQKR